MACTTVLQGLVLGAETVTCKSSASAAVYRLSTSKHPLFQSQPAEVSFGTCTY